MRRAKFLTTPVWLSLLLVAGGACDVEPEPELARKAEPEPEPEPKPEPTPTTAASPEQPEVDVPEPSADPVEITSISVRRSRPSLGSGGSDRSATIGRGHFDDPGAWEAEITKLLDETRVKDAATLREYAAAVLQGDQAKLAQIAAAGDPRAVEDGGYYTSMTLTTKDGETVEIRHVEAMRLTGHWHKFFSGHIRDRLRGDAGPSDRALGPG